MPIGELLIDAPTVQFTESNHDVLALFEKAPDQHAVAVLNGQLPVGLINRKTFVDHFSRPYYRELFARRSCLQFAKTKAICRTVSSLPWADSTPAWAGAMTWCAR